MKICASGASLLNLFLDSSGTMKVSINTISILYSLLILILRPYDPNDCIQSCLVLYHGVRENNTVLYNYHRGSYNSGSINKDLSCVGNATQEKELAQKLAQKEDLRVQRTRKLLQQALIELTVEMGFAAVTVRDITRRAMVNRSTFYRHYLDKYDLLNQYMADVQALPM